ncbi:hypothetical protein HKX48_001544 [Thoreauomyces humboldtii]|nr:hypothetical protein HKX48_001544 [Thoreauomyces humboldtii]
MLDRYAPAGALLPIESSRSSAMHVGSPEMHRFLASARPINTPFTVDRSGAKYTKPSTPPQYELIVRPAVQSVMVPKTPPSSPASPITPIVRNARGMVVRSCLKSADAKQRRRDGKKGLTFGETLENVCLYKRGSFVTDIKQFEQYQVKDTGDLLSPTLSASLALLETWIIGKKNIPAVPDFKDSPVILERVWVDNGHNFVGNILVRNLSYQKAVTVRYTIDGWASSHDVGAVFLNVCSPDHLGISGLDRFAFRIDLIREFGQTTADHHIAFAIRYDVGGQTHWDSNHGANYDVVLKRPTSPPLVVAVPVPQARPRFAWHDPSSDKSTNFLRPASHAPIPAPAVSRAIPVPVANRHFVAVETPGGHPISSPPPTPAAIGVPLSAEQRRKMRAVAIAKTTTLQSPATRYWSPVPSPPNGRCTPPLTAYAEAIEMPFSAASTGMGFSSQRPSVGGSGLYADPDNIGYMYGSSPSSGVGGGGYAACHA